MSKPRVMTNPVANRYSAPHERIVEFSAPNGNGGLISLMNHDDGTLSVHVYNYGPRVAVHVGKPVQQAKR